VKVIVSTSPECLAGLGYINTTATLPKLNSLGLWVENSWFQAPSTPLEALPKLPKKGKKVLIVHNGTASYSTLLVLPPSLHFLRHCWQRGFSEKNKLTFLTA